MVAEKCQKLTEISIVLESREVDLVFPLFSFSFYFYFQLFFYFLFLELRVKVKTHKHKKKGMKG